MEPDDMMIDDESYAMPIDEAPETEDGEVNPTDVCANKIFIDGLNEQVENSHILNYANTHYPNEDFKKLEWINDNSLNIVYSSDLAAAEALEAFSLDSHSDPLQPRRAQPLASLPDVELSVRLATIADVKKPGAAAQSRFYLQNPDKDPLNHPFKSRKRPHNGRSHIDRSDHHRYRQRDYEDRTPAAGLNYDEEPTGDERNARREIMTEKGHGRLRDRSASPTRGGDGRYGFAEEQPYRRTARARSPTPTRNRNNQDARRNLKKTDLFSKEAKARAGAAEHNAGASRELFPEKAVHRRQDARDLSPDDIAHAIGSYHITHDSHAAADPHDPGRPPQGDLFARTEPTYGRLANNPGQPEVGFSIRGAGSRAGDTGFSFLGASRETTELLPHKLSRASRPARARAERSP